MQCFVGCHLDVDHGIWKVDVNVGIFQRKFDQGMIVVQCVVGVSELICSG